MFSSPQSILKTDAKSHSFLIPSLKSLDLKIAPSFSLFSKDPLDFPAPKTSLQDEKPIAKESEEKSEPPSSSISPQILSTTQSLKLWLKIYGPNNKKELEKNIQKKEILNHHDLLPLLSCPLETKTMISSIFFLEEKLREKMDFTTNAMGNKEDLYIKKDKNNPSCTYSLQVSKEGRVFVLLKSKKGCLQSIFSHKKGLLGRGMQASVKSCIDLSNYEYYAQVIRQRMSLVKYPIERENAIFEKLKKHNYPYLPLSQAHYVSQKKGWSISSIFPLLGNEYARDLFDLRAGTNLSFSQKLYILKTLVENLCLIHDAKIIHRDLKMENIGFLEKEEGYYCFPIDFSLSLPLSELNSMTAHQMTGTLLYLPPEQICAVSGLKFDIWPLGLIALELLDFSHPIIQQRHTYLLDRRCNIDTLNLLYQSQTFQESLELLENSQQAAHQLCASALKKDPKERCTAQEFKEKMEILLG